MNNPSDPAAAGAVEVDPHGLDRDFIVRNGRTIFRFLHDVYWRVEVTGLEHIPAEGPVVLTGIHRNIVPFDAIMTLHEVFVGTGRITRFLIHPALLRFQPIGRWVSSMGGVEATRQGAQWILERGDILGMFPEGVHGAFSEYRSAYRLHSFGRHDYVALALRYRAPILPFVNVGSAEIYPVIKNLRWKWWQKKTGWPCLPITPTFPLLPPIPLPSKWHTVYMEPIDFSKDYPPEAAKDRKLVRRLSEQVQAVLLRAMTDIRKQRPSIFWGNCFQHGIPTSDLPEQEPSS